MKNICISCGKEAKIESFCDECWLRGKNLLEIGDFDLKVCDCGSCFMGGQWKKFPSFDAMLNESIKRRIKSFGKIENLLTDKKTVGNRVEVNLFAEGRILPCKSLKKEEHRIRINIRRMKCEDCRKKCASYYEAVIQLRENAYLNDVLKIGGESVTSVHEVRGGYDIYLKENEVAKKIAGFLIKKGLKIVRSANYITQKNNKKIYKNYYSVKV